MYTVTTINPGILGKVTCETLADAALLKAAWEYNQRWAMGTVVVFDQYDYLVPASELKIGLAIKENEIRSQLAYIVGPQAAAN